MYVCVWEQEGSKISRITDTDGRKVAAFQLHLQGPANTWCSCLDEDDRSDLENLVAAFELNYCAENNRPVLFVETEQFTYLKLLPHQQIEYYYSQILEKGKKLSNSEQEQLLKFIPELPAQLAFSNDISQDGRIAWVKDVSCTREFKFNSGDRGSSPFS